MFVHMCVECCALKTHNVLKAPTCYKDRDSGRSSPKSHPLLWLLCDLGRPSSVSGPWASPLVYLPRTGHSWLRGGVLGPDWWLNWTWIPELKLCSATVSLWAPHMHRHKHVHTQPLTRPVQDSEPPTHKGLAWFRS